MKRNTSLLVAGIAVIAVVAGGGYYLSTQGSSGAPDFTYAAMPMGITLEPLGTAQGYATAAYRYARPARNEIVYANDKGLTLYTYDKDEPGKSNCTGDCAKAWIPAAAGPNAEPVADWTLVSRDDGTKQWAHKGKPLYSFTKDKEGGDVAGGPTGGGGRMADIYGAGSVTMGKMPQGWHPAMFQTGGVPTTGVVPPFGINVKEVTDANSVVFIDSRNMVVYEYDGDVNNDRLVCANTTATCISRFTPLAAPQLAHPGGDWTFTKRDDGIRQWAYKGKPLYTYDGDLVVGDVNGTDVDKRWHLAAVENYYLPANVTIRQNPGRGKILATADGRTLYRREPEAWSNSAKQDVHDIPYRPRVGRTIRQSGCDAECLKTWHPYAAPADAQANGYWGVATLADGSKAWTYKDYLMYTYDGDKKAGDMTGDDIYDVVISDDPNKVNDVGFPMAGPAGLHWIHTTL